MRHGKVSSQPLLLLRNLPADDLEQRPPLHVVIAEAVLQVRFLDPGQVENGFGVLPRHALENVFFRI